jgi:NADH:ubiquinone oxidoreductase subunit 3 (subunit A)
LLYEVLGIKIHIIIHYYSLLLLLFIVHDKIIMLIGTWRTTRENSATTRVACDALD